MDVMSNNYMPGDPRLVQQLVYELKSQGIFDQFRRECISDVDTKPAYQNLRQRVEGSVVAFLKEQTWKLDMNKNQVREQLRKNIYESGYLETGVERIVDQVVNPKINSIFLPRVEDVLYGYLGLQKPTRDIKKEPNLTDLLPTDLDAISPESVHSFKYEDNDDDKKCDSEIMGSAQDSVNSKIDEDESPPFEPLEVVSNNQPRREVQEENSVDSQLSGFSGLQSHESNHGSDTKNAQSDFRMDWSNQESQVSQNSSDSRLSIITSDNTKMEICEESESKSFEYETKMANGGEAEIIKANEEINSNEILQIDKEQKEMDSQESRVEVNSVDTLAEETGVVSDKKPDSKSSGDKKHEEKRERENKSDEKKKSDAKKSRSSDKHGSKEKKHDKYKDDKHKSSNKDKSNSKSTSSSSKERSKDSSSIRNKDKVKEGKISKSGRDKEKDKSADLLSTKDKERTKEEKESKSDRDKEKDKSDRTRDRSDKEKSREKHRDKDKSEDKSSKEKDRAKREGKHDKERSSKDKNGERTREKSDKDRVKSSDKSFSRDKEKSSDKTKGATEKTKERSEMKKNEEEKTKSEKTKHKDKSDTKDKSDRTNKKEKVGSSSSSKYNTEKDRSSSKHEFSSSKKKEKSDSASHFKSESGPSKSSQDKPKKNKKHSSDPTPKKSKEHSLESKKEPKDDHYSLKEKKSSRRSFDRDSNDGHSNKSSQSHSNAHSENSRQSYKESSSSFSGNGSGDSGNSDPVEKTIVKDTESPKTKEVLFVTDQKVKYVKPKFASNFEEARKIMKIRKQLALLEKQNKLSLAQIRPDMPTENGLSENMEENPSKIDACPNENHTNKKEIKINLLRQQLISSDKVIAIKPSDLSRPLISPLKIAPDVLSKDSTMPKVISPKNIPPLQTTNLSKESWEALEARLAQEMSNIDYHSYESQYDDYDDVGYTPVIVSPRKNVTITLIEDVRQEPEVNESCGDKIGLTGTVEIRVTEPKVTEESRSDAEKENDKTVDEEMKEEVTNIGKIDIEIADNTGGTGQKINATVEDAVENLVEEKSLVVVLEEASISVKNEKTQAAEVDSGAAVEKVTEPRNKSYESEESLELHSVKLNDCRTEMDTNEVTSEIHTEAIPSLSELVPLEIMAAETEITIVSSVSDEECRYLEPPSDNLQQQLDYLNKSICKLEKDLEHSIKASQNNFLPVRRGRKRKLNENVDVKNNNKDHFGSATALKRQRGRPPKSKSGVSNAKTCGTTDVSTNQSFCLPLSPAESEKSVEKNKEEALKSPKHKRMALRTPTPRTQRYSSEDLYKPRPAIGLRKSRGAKNT